jgi:hypothetical protein
MMFRPAIDQSVEDEYNQQLDQARKYGLSKFLRFKREHDADNNETKKLTEFLKNLIALKISADNSENNPLTLLKNLKNKEAEKVRVKAKDFTSSINEIIKHAIGAVRMDCEGGILTTKERCDSLDSISNTLKHATQLVESRFKEPNKIKIVLDDANIISKPKLVQYCLKNPERTALVAAFIQLASIGLMVLGAIKCATVVGMPVGVGMIAAGLALMPLAIKLIRLAGVKPEASNPEASRAYNSRDFNLAKMGDGLKALAKSTELGNVFSNAYNALKKAASKIRNKAEVTDAKTEVLLERSSRSR